MPCILSCRLLYALFRRAKGRQAAVSCQTRCNPLYRLRSPPYAQVSPEYILPYHTKVCSYSFTRSLVPLWLEVGFAADSTTCDTSALSMQWPGMLTPCILYDKKGTSCPCDGIWPCAWLTTFTAIPCVLCWECPNIDRTLLVRHRQRAVRRPLDLKSSECGQQYRYDMRWASQAPGGTSDMVWLLVSQRTRSYTGIKGQEEIVVFLGF